MVIVVATTTNDFSLVAPTLDENGSAETIHDSFKFGAIRGFWERERIDSFKKNRFFFKNRDYKLFLHLF